MATKATTDVKSERPTFASDFIKSDVEQAVFLGNPVLDNLVTSLVAVCSELWANRRRTRILESLLAEKGISHEMIEGYLPSEQEEAAWQAERDHFIEMALGPLMREGRLPLTADRPGQD